MATAALPRLADRVGRYGDFRRWLRIGMVANVLVGLVLMIFPAAVQDALALPATATSIWLRYIGLFIVVITASYLPAAVYPPAARFIALYAVLVRFAFVVFFLIAGGGFYVFALFDAFFGVMLAWSFLRGLRQDLDKRP